MYRFSKKKNARHHISKSLRAKVWKKSNGCCKYGGHKLYGWWEFKEMTWFERTTARVVCMFYPRAHVDHIIPVTYQGATTEENLVLSCGKHNRIKSGYVLLSTFRKQKGEFHPETQTIEDSVLKTRCGL